MENNYTLVLFPEVQTYMEESWFDKEAILYQTINEEQEYESSAYFIPNKYIHPVEEKGRSMFDILTQFTADFPFHRGVQILPNEIEKWIKENL